MGFDRMRLLDHRLGFGPCIRHRTNQKTVVEIDSKFLSRLCSRVVLTKALVVQWRSCPSGLHSTASRRKISGASLPPIARVWLCQRYQPLSRINSGRSFFLRAVSSTPNMNLLFSTLNANNPHMCTSWLN
ncbi:hypothetical protein M404DRAFT_713977 [Pisolithus tinctorius Marx 270]|uniref:Uncharacterized protein n=1 Tax=Pisolithus tinctorius Marx 270 TaxID=870435 RepID=A0A0C3P3V1_PISTI|nr:hypothetical protein M404DRAFT_713977 [Pisolithus tinctorius Marx 270]